MHYPLNLGCTAWKHFRLGIHAVVNARAGEQWRNHETIEEIELQRDARAIKTRLQSRVRFYQFNSKFFRRKMSRVEHLLSRHDD